MNVNSSSSSSSALIAAYTSAANTRGTDARGNVASSDQATGKTQNDDSVNFSSTATDYSDSIASNAPYFPVRAGMNADALILGVAKPGAISSSKDKTFADVALDARKRMDEKYALMKDSGKPYDNSVQDRNALMGDLDRRSLYAISTNEGGKFSKEEQTAAQDLMRQQAQLATGYYVGPEDQKKNWKDPFANDPVGRAKAALNFLDNMSPEEKSTPQWLTQRSTIQTALSQATAADPVELAKKKQLYFPILAEILQNGTSWFDKKEADEDKSSELLNRLQAAVQSTK
ncbi:hypothetical protein PS918_00561 [Pseudomonas fluorescens]|uniref:Uncharacterized protein n=1 Tax=Pseudomonas fluorescens TaxID=294 RepID=A0A5E7QZ43_PSEFL|nr:hypothetical protein [Pseudomonas fluorescens]VVP67376.1 hypothetical protein PS918_00561 [Pseudomonas fluorescens]